MKQLEIWGGLECTLTRVGDSYINQLDKSGHDQRLSDLKLFKDLGIKNLRYGCLWETIAPKDLDHCDWSLVDKKLEELKKLDLSFIAGFLHHGSGPQYTSLIDPDFPEKFATFARLFATRYPWVQDYTPINEINTTARFSCLTGHWYPHLKNDLYYLKAVILQSKATILAMREIRAVNPKARLIQTEDIGKCQSTDLLKYQRDFENERRWLSFDLLCGKVNEDHALYSYIIQAGIRPEELSWFEDNAYIPDVLGLNHYHLSNRYLDEKLDLYPESYHVGNGTHQYADVSALQTGQTELPETEEILLETWNRFQIPIAITECHTKGRRESQMRWLQEVWKAAENVRSQGVDVLAVTVWGLLGSYDRNDLYNSGDFFYEPGVFDLKDNSTPVATALSKLVFDLASQGYSTNPVIASEGTWKTPRRILWGAKEGEFTRLYHRSEVKPLLITGAKSDLAQTISEVCGSRNIFCRSLTRREMDLLDIDAIENMLELHKPWAVINTVLDEKGSEKLAKVCADMRIPLLNFSNDISFIHPDSLIVHPLTEDSEKIANECLDLMIDEVRGTVYITGEDDLSWDNSYKIDPQIFAGLRDASNRHYLHSAF